MLYFHCQIISGSFTTNLMFKISMKGVLFAVPRVILSISLMITALVVATPLYPIMPSSGLDASWMYAINEAVADGFAFGREVVVTFGPYGAIYTRMFHPGTDALVMGAGLFFGLCFGAVSILLARSSLWWGLCMLFVVGSQIYVRDDVVFASYGLLLVMAVSNAAWATLLARRNFSHFKSALFVALLFVLGLLPLIKGSLIINAAAASIAAFFLFFDVQVDLSRSDFHHRSYNRFDGVLDIVRPINRRSSALFIEHAPTHVGIYRSDEASRRFP